MHTIIIIDTALCSFGPMNTTSDCMTDGAVVTTTNAAAATTASSAPTTTSTVSAVTSTASPSPDSESSTTPPEGEVYNHDSYIIINFSDI